MKSLTLFSLIFIFSISLGLSQEDSSCSKFILIKSQGIDYYPVWGENDNFLFINLFSSEWRKYDLDKSSYWFIKEQDISINTAENYSVIEDAGLIQKLQEDKNWQAHQISTKDHQKFIIEPNGFSTILLIEDSEGNKEKIMNLPGNSHSLAISPNEKYLALIVEMVGLLIIDIKKEVSNINIKKEKLAKLSTLEKATYYYELQDFENLEKSIEKFSSKEMKTTDFNFYKGLIFFYKSRQDESLAPSAIKYLEKAKQEKKFKETCPLLSILYQSQKNWKKALIYAEKTIEIFPDSPSGYSLKGDCLKNQDKEKEACEMYQLALEKGDQYAQLKLKNCK